MWFTPRPNPAALALVMAFSCVASAQEGTERGRPIPRTSNSPAAIVMGHVITQGEIEKILPSIMRENPDAPKEVLLWQIRFELGRVALLAQTAKLYIPEVQDEQVVSFFSAYGGVKEDVIKKDIKMFRNRFYIMYYIRARMGLVTLPGVSPDFASFINITPQETRSYYHQKFRTSEPRPEKIKVAQFLFPKSSFYNQDRLKDAVKQCGEMLSNPETRPENLSELSDNWEGCIFMMNEIETGKKNSLRPEIMDFINIGDVGDVSLPIDLGNAQVLACILDRRKETIPTFEECQDKLRSEIIRRKEDLVQEWILAELIGRADYWPKDLFIPPDRMNNPTQGPQEGPPKGGQQTE